MGHRPPPNDLLRQARLRRVSPTGSGRPMSRQELAEQVNDHLYQRTGRVHALDASYVGKLERGQHRWPNDLYREAFRTVLGATCDTDLGFHVIRGHVSPSLDGPRPSAGILADAGEPLSSAWEDPDLWLRWSHVALVESMGRFTRKDLTVDRRDATRVLLQLVVGASLLEPVERWLSAAPAGSARDRGGLGGVGAYEVDQLEKTAVLFRDWDDRVGGGLRRKAVVGQLSEVSDLLRDPHPADISRRLFGVMSQLAETAAMMSWDSGHDAVAQRYYVLALHAAKTAGDHAFAANVLAGMARQLLYLDRPGDALELIRLAQAESTGQATARVRAMLHTREAWAYARSGRVSAFHRATEKAEEALAEAGDRVDEEDPDWIRYFTPAELAGVTGGRLLDLARARRPRLAAEAATHIERAIDLRDGQRLRSAALDQLGLAEARFLQGEVEEGARLGHQAIHVVERTPSERVRVKLSALHRHTSHYGQVCVVAELRDRMRSTLTVSRH